MPRRPADAPSASARPPPADDDPAGSDQLLPRVLVEYRDGRPQQQAGAAAASSGLRQLLVSAFLPVGWPDSVTPDYTGFVAWNTVQAVSSYVRGVLSSHAVFKGVGVGSEAATALGAVFQFFVRDILGMAGGIVFAYAAGGSFDCDAKQWRLFADVMNDAAMLFDLASPLVPGGFMVMASLGSVARAVVGMSAGATGAALTQHFGGRGSNAADISAKADSRERATSILGALLGMAATRHLADHLLAAWAFFLVLTWVHVWANMRALRCLVLSSLNAARLRLLLHSYEAQDKVLTPQQVAGMESLVVPPLAALLDWARGHSCSIRFGARLTHTLTLAAQQQQRQQQQQQQQQQVLRELVQRQSAAARRQYLLLVTGSRSQQVHVVLHHSADQHVQLQAYLHALRLASLLRKGQGLAKQQELLDSTAAWVDKRLPAFSSALRQQGWQLDKVYLPHVEWTADW